VVFGERSKENATISSPAPLPTTASKFPERLTRMALESIGKGNKQRRCPLWARTVNELLSLLAKRLASDHVFRNRWGQPLTRFRIHALVKRYAEVLSATRPSMTKKRASPHTIRHTTATHLLRAGVDINTIRAWLGHVCLSQTSIYAEVDLQMKAKAFGSTIAILSLAMVSASANERRQRP
jgi:integrase/recombinase XerD